MVAAQVSCVHGLSFSMKEVRYPVFDETKGIFIGKGKFSLSTIRQKNDKESYYSYLIIRQLP
jgi:hypothetical protein